MKIIHIASGDLWAGAEVQLYHLATELVKISDITLLVVLLNHGQLEQKLIAKGISVKVINESKLSFLQIVSEFKSIAQSFSVEIIHSHRIKENIIGGIVAMICKCKNIRTIHGDIEQTDTSWSLRAFALKVGDRFFAHFVQDKIIAVSDELYRKLAERYNSNKIVAINNSINVDYIIDSAKQPIDTNINSKNINIGFVGRFVHVKRVKLFYQIAKEVIRKNTDLNVHFHMIGDGPELDDIKASVLEDNVDEKIHLIGFVENSAPYIKRLDYLMFTSKHEGLPMVLLESMALETAVISTNLSTVRTVLQNELAGYFPDSEDYKIFAERVSQIIREPNIKLIKSQEAKKILESQFALSTNIDKYVQLYKDTLT